MELLVFLMVTYHKTNLLLREYNLINSLISVQVDVTAFLSQTMVESTAVEMLILDN